MSTSYLTNMSSAEETRKSKYQPSYPLKYDPNDGPYESIETPEESIKRNFEALLLTSPGEWPMDPQLGIGVKRFLFENFENFDQAGLQATITNQISKYLTSVKLLGIKLDIAPDDRDRNTASIKIAYSIMGGTVVNSSIVIDDSGFPTIDTISMNKHASSFVDRVANIPSQMTRI